MSNRRVSILSLILSTPLFLAGCSGASSIESSGAITQDQSQASTVDAQNPLNLDSKGIERVNSILNEFGSDDPALNALTNCIAKYYDDLNSTFFDPRQRLVPMANVQDCTEELNPDVFCRPAEDGSGPVCGLTNRRTGYSLAAVFGSME